MQTKHAHEHFDLLINVDMKTNKDENFSIIRHKTIYFLEQEYMSHKPHPSQREGLVTLQLLSYRRGTQLLNTGVR